MAGLEGSDAPRGPATIDGAESSLVRGSSQAGILAAAALFRSPGADTGAA